MYELLLSFVFQKRRLVYVDRAILFYADSIATKCMKFFIKLNPFKYFVLETNKFFLKKTTNRCVKLLNLHTILIVLNRNFGYVTENFSPFLFHITANVHGFHFSFLSKFQHFLTQIKQCIIKTDIVRLVIQITNFVPFSASCLIGLLQCIFGSYHYLY